jgi:hypothetical protein
MDQNLIDQFLFHYQQGLISGKPGTSAPAVLDRMAWALSEVKPMQSGPGRPGSDNYRLAELAYVLKESKVPWDQVTKICAQWALSNQHPILSKGSLQNLVTKHAAAIEAGLELAELMAKESQKFTK